jgi:high-affinity nickel permease
MVEVPEKNVLIITNNGTEFQSLQVIDLKEYKIKQTIKKEGGYNFFIGLLVKIMKEQNFLQPVAVQIGYGFTKSMKMVLFQKRNL